MPYRTNADLPQPVRDHLPEHAQDIYREVFNNAWVQYEHLGPRRQEVTAHRVAWAAVKKRYEKIGVSWVSRE